jgi:hypothetical protein
LPNSVTKDNIVGQTHIKKPPSTQATAPEKSTLVEQDNNKTPNENSQNEPCVSLLSCSLEGSFCEFSLGVLLLSCSTGVLFSGAVACVLVGFFIWV